ncbi:hypothetical protein DSO57_1001510 [Entomophthora muscae]|uniref:Uncharacterized protein n=4 Tax=Entomophthora muscae TaxID=34485 RepID=A0ACC2UV87_9FUNG|nr:hypothetical protein DSO57_1001510 [Entomophthora muscae]
MEYIPRKDIILSPYALINQNRPADKRDNKFDMYMQLNTADRFIYPDEYGSHSKSKNADVIRMIVHELSHGLGLYSKLTVNCAIPNFIGPYTTYLYNKTHNTLMFHKTLFDTHLRPYNSSLKFPTATTFLFGDLNFNSFFPTIHTKPEINDTGFLSTHKNTTYFLTKYNTRVDIDTQTSTAQGSSFSHVSPRYRNSTEFLMTHLGVYYSVFLEDSSVNQYWKTAPLGNATVEMLETIGYQKNPTPNRNLSQIGLYEQMLPFNKKEGDQVYKNMHSEELIWAIFLITNV